MTFEALPEFSRYLWFLARWAEFQTPFLVACDLAETAEEQDALRPSLEKMAAQYVFDKGNGSLLSAPAFWDWFDLYAEFEAVRERFAEAWLAAL